VSPYRRRYLIAWGNASMICGLCLAAVGARLHAFSGEGRSFGVTIFVLFWLISVMGLGAYLRDNPPKDKDGNLLW
jgi:hypothetical protein